VSDFQLGAPLSEVGNPGPERLDQGDFEWPALEWADRGLIVTGMIARRRGRHRDPGVAETSGGRAVRVVLDPQDCGRCTRVLTELHHLGAGRVVCHPRPGGARAQLGADLLAALGKRHDALELEHLGGAPPRFRIGDPIRSLPEWRTANAGETAKVHARVQI
jgi:hypothetical protein